MTTNIIPRTEHLSPKEEQELFTALKDPNISQEEEEKIKTKITSAHSDFIQKETTEWHKKNPHRSRDHIFEHVLLGLSIALNKYDPDNKGKARFGTYARHWIKAEILDNVMANAQPVKFVTSAWAKFIFFNYSKARETLTNSNNPNPTTRQVAEALTDTWISQQKQKGNRHQDRSVLIDKFEETCKLISGTPLALNATMGDDSEGTFMDVLKDQTTPSPEQAIIKKQKSQFNTEFLAAAKEHFYNTSKQREWDILSARKLQENPRTLENLSQIYKVSKERVRQLEVAGFTRLQKFAKTYTEAFNTQSTPPVPVSTPIPPPTKARKKTTAPDLKPLDNLLPLLKEKYMAAGLHREKNMERNWNIYLAVRLNSQTQTQTAKQYKVTPALIGRIIKKMDPLIQDLINQIQNENPEDAPTAKETQPTHTATSIQQITPEIEDVIQEKYMQEILFTESLMKKNWSIYMHTQETKVTQADIIEYFKTSKQEIDTICQRIDAFIAEKCSDITALIDQAQEPKTLDL